MIEFVAGTALSLFGMAKAHVGGIKQEKTFSKGCSLSDIIENYLKVLLKKKQMIK